MGPLPACCCCCCCCRVLVRGRDAIRLGCSCARTSKQGTGSSWGGGAACRGGAPVAEHEWRIRPAGLVPWSGSSRSRPPLDSLGISWNRGRRCLGFQTAPQARENKRAMELLPAAVFLFIRTCCSFFLDYNLLQFLVYASKCVRAQHGKKGVTLERIACGCRNVTIHCSLGTTFSELLTVREQ